MNESMSPTLGRVNGFLSRGLDGWQGWQVRTVPQAIVILRLCMSCLMLHAPCPMHDAGPFHPTFRPQPNTPTRQPPKPSCPKTLHNSIFWPGLNIVSVQSALRAWRVLTYLCIFALYLGPPLGIRQLPVSVSFDSVCFRLGWIVSLFIFAEICVYFLDTIPPATAAKIQMKLSMRSCEKSSDIENN